MTRKDSEKDAERPHYYSQFWLDVAAGRRVIGMPKPNEDVELVEAELPEPAAPRKTGRNSEVSASADGHAEASVRPVAEPVAAPKEFIEPDEVADESEAEELQDTEVEDKDIPDVDLDPAEDELEDEEQDDEEKDEFFDEEEDEDLGWANRGRKKPKVTRVVKQPVKKPGKRDRRPGY